MNDVRRNRTVGVTEALGLEDRQNLLQLRQGPMWPSVLNVMERYCIEQESELIRTSVRDDAAIIAQHAKAQAAWEMFEHFQENVNRTLQLAHELQSYDTDQGEEEEEHEEL